ncbi:MAG: trans-sulfuration enzyme family protein [bacterium]
MRKTGNLTAKDARKKRTGATPNQVGVGLKSALALARPSSWTPPREARDSFPSRNDRQEGGAAQGHGPKPLSTPIYQTSAFQFHSLEELQQAMENWDYTYSRLRNPTIEALELEVARLEGAEKSVAFASGMAAISTTVLALAHGGHIVAMRDLYGATGKLLTDLTKFGIETSFVPTDRPDGALKAARPNTKLLYLETPTNPTIKIVDIPEWVGIAKKIGAKTAIDATFATPYNLKPLALGIDVVIHSMTKFMSGHEATLGGVASGSRSTMKPIEDLRIYLGGVMDPHQAWLTSMGMKTLSVRMTRHNANAAALAAFLASHPKVSNVNYPGLKTSRYFALSKKLLRSPGGVLSFELKGGVPAVRALVANLRLARLAPTLGGISTIVTHPYSTSHRWVTEAVRQEMGVTPGLLRVSCGIDDTGDLIADFENALEVA